MKPTRASAMAAMLLAPPLVALLACGGGARTPPTAPPPASAPTGPAESAAPTSTGPSTYSSAGLPPLRPAAPVPVATSTVATTRADAAWAACHRDFKPAGGDVARDVAALGRACEAVTRMKPTGAALSGKQAAEDPPQSYPFDARAGRCYRVYAAASDGIRDLDVALRDSTGIAVGRDSTADRAPVVPDDGAACFSKDDRASVVVSVGAGKGSYAVQIWGD